MHLGSNLDPPTAEPQTERFHDQHRQALAASELRRMTERFPNVSSYDTDSTLCAIIKHKMSFVSTEALGQNVVMSLGERIKHFRKLYGMSQGELASALGYPDGEGQSTVSSWERDRTEPSRDMVQKIAGAIGVSVADIEGTTSDNVSVPIRERDGDKIYVNHLDIRFGMGGGAHYDAPVEARPMSFSRAWLEQLTSAKPENLFWASGFGDSMYPTIGDRDLVLVDTSQKEPRIRDQIWALNQYGQGMIKRLRATEDGYLILSDNKDVPADTASDGSMEIVGRVVAVIRRV